MFHCIKGQRIFHRYNVPASNDGTKKQLFMVFHREHNTLRQYSWCCAEGISLLITSATIWSPIYPNLWMCLVRDSGLFIFLAQILIWSYPAAVLSQLYRAWIRNFHTHTSVQYPDCFLFLQCLTACLTILHRFLSYTWHVRPILAVSWQPHCLLPHIWAAGSVVPFLSASVTRDCKQS